MKEKFLKKSENDPETVNKKWKQNSEFVLNSIISNGFYIHIFFYIEFFKNFPIFFSLDMESKTKIKIIDNHRESRASTVCQKCTH